jgi:PilZ domain
MRNFMSKLMRDRRAAYRHSLKIPLRYRIRRRSASEHLSESTNVSESGIYFETDQELSVGAIVDLHVEMPTEINGTSVSHWLCTGHVVRVDPSKLSTNLHLIGVQFDCYEVLPSTQKVLDTIEARAVHV